MYHKFAIAALVAVLVINQVDAKKSRRNKRPKAEDEPSTPQPSVLTYSTFGFNDVGSYDGFVPSSPDYANYLSSHKQEATTRLYAPAFPTALDSSGFTSYGSQPTEEQSFPTDSDQQISMLQYPQSSMNFFSGPSFGPDNERDKNVDTEDIYSRNTGDSNSPIYGTKIGSKNKNKVFSEFNNTDVNVFNSGSSVSSNDGNTNSKYEHKPSFTEFDNSNQGTYSYPQAYSPIDVEQYNMKNAPNNGQSLLNFPKVIDFTKTKYSYTKDQDGYPHTPPSKSLFSSNSASGHADKNIFTNKYEDSKYKISPPSKNIYESKDNEEPEKEPNGKIMKQEIPAQNSGTNYNFKGHKYNFGQDSNDFATKDEFQKPNIDFKDKAKTRPWFSTDNNDENSDNLKSHQNNNNMKGYNYSTNHSSTSFRYDFSDAMKPFKNNIDEIVPASSNIYSPTYQFPETDYSAFKKIPSFKPSYDDEVSTINFFNTKDQYKQSVDSFNPFKNLYGSAPSISSNWGDVFKTKDFSSHKKNVRKPSLDDDDDIVHIPKKLNAYKYGKYFDSKPNEWSSYNSFKPYTLSKPELDWSKEITKNRFKLEEDLLGLRNHDTSQPSYLPFKHNAGEEQDFKKLVQKWKQSYLKSKYASLRDYESYASDSKPVHVPVPKPYPIEVPHPVIVPVPQPYPVHVPVPKPVAVPVIQELTVPIEKPVPYPVFKKVPYPIEKPVPVPVEKQVPVPVVKPYPVPVPHVRPVFHHTRTREEYDSDEDDHDDYLPRPENKRIPYAKRPKSPRTRGRRPVRITHLDRNRRRWPQRRPSSSREQRYPKSPSETQYSPPYRYRDNDFEEYDHEQSDYLAYCKRTGAC